MTTQHNRIQVLPHKNLLLPLTACLLSLSVIGCNEMDKVESKLGVNLEPTSTVTSTKESWPGGSLQDWNNNGTVQSHTRTDRGSHGGTGYSYSEGSYAEDTYDEAPTSADDYAPGDPSSGGEETGSSRDTAIQESALEGGEIDDNDDLEAFIAYLEDQQELYGEDPSIEWLDVSRRQLITVQDSFGVTVPDTRLTFWSEEGRMIQIGRTRADGRFAFFPNLFEEHGHIEVEAESPYGVSQLVHLDTEASELLLEIDGERPPVQEINLEVAFIIDATGSMGGEISRLKDTVTNIAERVVQDGVRLRLGAVAYRDRGDEYTTQSFNFTEDVAAFQEVINGLEADGGGDYPEALNEALEETQRRLSWTREESLRLTFLITDAPAHYYDKQSFNYAQGVLDAQQMGMKIFPIASGGSDGVAEVQLRQIAQHTLGHFIFITEGNGSSQGSEGSDYHVDPAQFDVERLDDLVVRLINEEVEAWRFEITELPL